MATYTQNINPKSAYQLIMYVEESFANDYVATNKSTVTVTGVVKHNGNTLYSAVWGSSSNTVNINGTKYYPTTGYSLKNSSSSQIFSYSVPIEHNADGSKTINVSWSFTGGDTSSQYNPNGSIGIDFTMQTIPRATKLAEQTFTINTAGTISWTKASSSFTHTLTYEFGTLSGTIGTGKVDSVEWTPPNTFYEQLKNSTSGTGKLFLTTYNGSTKIGDTQEAKLTINVKESEVKPTIDTFSVRDENSATKALTGDNSVLVLNKSTAFITLTFSVKKYATVKSVTINGKTINVSAGTTDSNGNTSYGATTDIGVATTGTFNVVINDSRSYNVTKSITNDIVNYVPLTAVTTFKRITPTGGQVGLTFNGNYFNGSFGASSNTLEISYKYKKSTDSTYTTINLVNNTDYKISGNTYYSGTGSSKQTITLAPTFDYKTQYDVQVVIKDKLTTLPTINAVISKGIPIMWWNGEKVQVNGELKVSNKTTLEKGTVNKRLNNGSGTTGYMYAFSLNMGNYAYQNQYFTFDVLQRDRYGTVRIVFASSGTGGTCSLKNIVTSGTITVAFTNTNNTFDLYIQKSEGYDDISIHNLSFGDYMTSINDYLVWKNQTVTSLPSGATVVTPNRDIYPIGSIYMSVNSTSPANLFGGTWTQLKDRFLLSAGDSYSNGATGGSATHTLSTAEMPKHKHNINDEFGQGICGMRNANGAGDGWDIYVGNSSTGTKYRRISYISGLSETGSGSAHNNMPPYLVVYMWKRTG